MAASRSKPEEPEFIIDGAPDDPLEVRAELERSTEMIGRLEEALTQERQESASLRAQLETMRAGGGKNSARPAKAFLLPVWAVMAARLFLGLAQKDANLFLADAAAVGCASILLEHWIKAQLREGAGVSILKTLFLILGLWLFLAYMALNAGGDHAIHPMGALLFVSFVMLLVLSPFCGWLKDGAVSFARHPVATVRGWFV